jgi:hypothetical protein
VNYKAFPNRDTASWKLLLRAHLDKESVLGIISSYKGWGGDWSLVGDMMSVEQKCSYAVLVENRT